MKIEEVITHAIVAIYSSPKLSELLILKGGGAIRLFDGIETRLSIDADFSIKNVLNEDADPVFKEMSSCLSKTFEAKGYDLLDFKHNTRP